MSIQPPKLIIGLLSNLCRPELWESIEGDLYELFLADLEKVGTKRARQNYFWNALAFLRYHRLRKLSTTITQNNMALYNHYFKVSWRNLWRNKTFSSINLIGLVSGMTIFLLILQYVLFENSFEKFHPDADRTYRVINERYQNGSMVQRGMITYPTIGRLLKEDFPEVDANIRLTFSYRNYLEFEGMSHLVNEMIYADEHFLTFFNFPVIIGDPSSALQAPFDIVLTESYAKILAEDDDLSTLIGQSIHLFDSSPSRITAIVQDPPVNSYLQFDLLVSYNSFISMAGEGADKSMEWSDFYHYVKLREGVDVASMDNKLAEFGQRHFKQGEISGAVEKFSLEPLLGARMDNSLEYEIGHVTDGKVVWLMLAIGLFILVIAWINYINLSTSRAIQRAREVGIRKSIGGNQHQLIRQFIVETGLTNIIALAVAIMMVLLLQPYFNYLTGLPLGMMVFINTAILGIPSALFIGTGMVLSIFFVAIYPSFLTSRFLPSEVLKGNIRLKGDIAWLRKCLVVFQFCIAVILITGVLVVNKQIDFMLNKDLGIDIEKNLVIYGPESLNFDSTLVTGVDRFKNELTALHGVDRVATTGRVAGSRMGRVFHVRSLKNPEMDNFTANFINVDHDYSEVFGLKLLAGRDFEITDHHADGSLVKNLLINESAVKLLGFNDPLDAVNTRLNFFGKDWTIVGVINDFHQMSLHNPIEPLFLLPYYNYQPSFAMKISGNPEQLLPRIEDIYLKHFPGNYFDYYFLKDRFQENYQAEFRLAEISGIFAFFSILVATLGLYGLVLITILRKTKEIGVRKVLGAGWKQLLFSVNKDFLFLIVISSLIGIPVALFGLRKWKESFAYSTDIGPGVLIIASVSLVLISLLTIGLHVGKIIRNNPVDSLRSE